jgi:cellulose synthase/poly-beta-1,6-N-acetylglucosamine synthase-like glycosyltransferase
MHFIPSFDFGLSLMTFVAFACFALVGLGYTAYFFTRLAFKKPVVATDQVSCPPVTIILAARNESDNLYENIPLLMQQDYPEFEVIVVNHQSIDDTTYLLSAYQRNYPNLRVIEVAKSPHLRPGKKLPLTLGVKGARYEHLVFTDADCKPASMDWLKGIVTGFSDAQQVVLGYGPISRDKGFLNRLVRFDTAWIGMSYMSFALAGKAYMGVGRNMAYTKSIFNEVNGFKSHYAISSGDDDLFVQDAVQKTAVSVVLDERTFCVSDGPDSWEGFVRQKSRHFTTSIHYEVIKKLLLGIYPASLLLTWLSFVILMFNTEYRWLTLVIFVVTSGLKWWFQGKSFSKLRETSFIPYLPFWELFHALVIPLIYYTADKKRTAKW